MRKKFIGLFPWLIALSVGAVGTLQYHLIQFTTRFDTFFGDRGDARGFVYFCEHWYQTLRGKANLVSPGIFYPVKGTLGYSDVLLGYGVSYSFFRALGMEMFSAVEAVLILLTFLSYVACFVLLYRVLRFHLLAACAGAAFFAFNSPKFIQTGHLQLQFVLFLPFIFICVIRFAQQSEWASQMRAFVWLSLAGLSLNLQLLTAFYHGWYIVFWSFLFIALSLLVLRSREFILSLVRRFWPAMIGALVTFIIGFIPFVYIYLPVARLGHWYPYEYVKEMIPSWWSFFVMGDGNYLWGWLTPIARPDPPPPTWGELSIGIGLVPSLAWIILTFVAIRLLFKYGGVGKSVDMTETERRQRGLLFLALLILATTVFYVLAMKYGNNHSLWKMVYYAFPGARAIRAVSRHVIFLALPMSIGFAFTLDYWLQRLAQRKDVWVREAATAALVLVAAFGVVEQFGAFKVGGTGFSKSIERAYLRNMAARLDKDCEAFYVAAPKGDKHNDFEYQYDAMVISSLSGIPTFNASSSQFPDKWLLYEVKKDDYEQNVQNWINLNHLKGKICRLELTPPVDAFDPHAPSAIDDPAFFVRQQYKDLLGREPTPAELQAQTDKLKTCAPADTSCDRTALSLSLYQSPEFYDRGFYLYRFYEAGLGRTPTYEEFTADMEKIRTQAAASSEEQSREAFSAEFVERPEFKNIYGALQPQAFVEKLAQTAGVALPDKDSLVNDLQSGSKSQAQVVRQIIESAAVRDRFANRAFVAMEYFGYLRRIPDRSGFSDWLTHLNQTGNKRELIAGFINSTEYRLRFKPK